MELYKNLERKIDISIYMFFALLFVYLGIRTIQKLSHKPQQETEQKIVIIDRSILNYDNVLFWLKHYNVKQHDIVIRQVALETGHLKSRVCRENNNLFGFFNGKRYLCFDNWIQSIACYKRFQKLHKYEESEDYYTFLKRIRYSENKDYCDILKRIEIDGIK